VRNRGTGISAIWRLRIGTVDAELDPREGEKNRCTVPVGQQAEWAESVDTR
jgi:hypothetical protein